MTDIERIVWGVFASITVYVIAQLISKFFIEPVYELRKAIGEVRYHLAFHRQTIHTPIGRTQENTKAAREALVKSSCELISKLHAVPGFFVCRYLTLCVLPNKADIEAAAIQLRSLSTYVYEEGDNIYANVENVNRRVAKIETLLRLKPLE
jgi:hypothetical protein